jgi:hypothetical protein
VGARAMIADVDLDQLFEEREWRRCFPQTEDPAQLLEGFLYFCKTYWWIRHPRRGRIKFELYSSQITAVKMWIEEDNSIILKARQIGWSTLVATFVLWETFGYSDRAIIMLSKGEREAVKLLNKSKYGYRFLPEWMKFRGPPMNPTQTKMEFSNESILESLPSASDPARGESVYRVVVDEMAFLPNSEEAYSSIEPITDNGGRSIVLSTAKGEGNLFHRLWVEATEELNRYLPMFFPWHANGRDQAWYDAKKAELPDWQMAQEYPDTPEEAFLKSGRPVFAAEVLAKVEPVIPLRRGFLDRHRSWGFVDDPAGPLQVWEWPDGEARYALGADVAEGFEHGDFSSVHIINCKTGVVVAHWHGHIDADLLATEVILPLGRLYRNALVGVESNNHGLVTLKYLQEKKYRPLYMQRSPRYKKAKPTDILGWRTTQITKPVAIDELNQSIRDGGVHLLDKSTLSELRSYVRDDAGRMSGSPFDDRVMSLAIANQMVRYVFLPKYEPQTEPGPGSMHWYESQLFGDSVADLMLGKSVARRSLDPTPLGEAWTR